jgi:hypothetical protein
VVAVLKPLATAALLGCALAPVAHADPEAKTSIALESDEDAWQRSGFRLGLGLAYGDLYGLRGPPSGRLLGPLVHVGLRLDRDWSIYSTFDYESASRRGGLSGLRFAGTIDPTWHVARHFALGVGFGFGGFVEGHTGRADAEPLGSTLDTSYTFTNAEMPIASCSGVGASGLVRGTYSHVIGPRAELVVELEIIGQETKCIEPTGTVEPDTAQPIVREQYWSHAGAQMIWGVTWR